MTEIDVQANDPTGFTGLVLDFPDQCVRTLKIAQAAPLPAWKTKPDSVVLTGLGGSAAGGDLVKALFDHEGQVPFFVNRDYSLPSWVGPGTLVFAASYSGGTEETLAAYADAKRRGASVIAVTSGGQLSELAKADGYPVVIVPGGQPPRTAMGYMMIPFVWASAQMGLIRAQEFDKAFEELAAAAAAWQPSVSESDNEAKQLARALTGKIGVLYGLGSWQWAVAQRWKGQINENAKEMAFTHVFPELCHNEILGWEGSGSQGVKAWVTVLLEGGDESQRLKDRVRLTCAQIETYTSFVTARAQGTSLLARLLCLAHLGDFVSLYLAALAGRDPAQMNAIDQLKAQLAQLS